MRVRPCFACCTPAVRAAFVPEVNAHVWRHFQGLWCCRYCLRTRASESTLLERESQPCPGFCPALRDVLEKPGGHRLAAAEVGDKPILFCLACGAYATSRPEALRPRITGFPATDGLAERLRRIRK